MSGEVAIGYAVVGVIGGSAWLAARGVQVGALVAVRSVELLGAGLVRIGDHTAGVRAQWEAGHAALLEWETAARRVIDVNSRLAVLRCHADPATAAGLPAELIPCAESPQELLDWCEKAAAGADRAERELLGRAVSAVQLVLVRSAARERPMTAQEAMREYHAAVADHEARRRTPPLEILTAVTRILADLPVDVDPDDRATALASASRVAAQLTRPRPDVDNDVLLYDLRLRVQQAHERAATRRDDALTAATLLQALPADDPDGGPDTGAVRRELAEVVAARRQLDQALRARAEQILARQRAELERAYVRASVAETLAGLGYEVDQDFATVTGNPDQLRLRRGDWTGHAVQVVVGDKKVKAAVVRLESRDGEDARREDTERESQWCADLDALREALQGAGVQVHDPELVAPGNRVLPVLRRRDYSAPAATAQRNECP